MTQTAKVVSVTLLLAIAAFLFGSHGPLGRTLGPAPVSLASPPTAMQEKLFMLLDVVEALAFGLGLAFVSFAWPAVKRVVPSTGCAAIMYVSTSWFLANWWIHDNFHMVVGFNPGGLLAIEYGFHVTLMVAAAALAYSLTIGQRRAH
jgi:hypothetical protein